MKQHKREAIVSEHLHHPRVEHESSLSFYVLWLSNEDCPRLTYQYQKNSIYNGVCEKLTKFSYIRSRALRRLK
jgi:hypothetical protein